MSTGENRTYVHESTVRHKHKQKARMTGGQNRGVCAQSAQINTVIIHLRRRIGGECRPLCRAGPCVCGRITERREKDRHISLVTE